MPIDNSEAAKRPLSPLSLARAGRKKNEEKCPIRKREEVLSTPHARKGQW
jgi:hypothetical protein